MGFQVGVILSVIGGVMAGVTFAIGVTCGLLAIPHRLRTRREMAARVKNKEKRAETYRYNMIKKHGSEEAYKEYMREIASRGGRKKKASDNGFAKSTEWAREAAARSHESRRRKKGNGEEVSAR